MNNQQKLHVLLAEDDIMLSGLLADGMRMQGWTVDCVFDGEKAIGKIQEAYDVIILDIMMPKKDGFAVLEEAKRLGIATPIVIASNMSEADIFNRTKALGAKEMIVKSNTDIDTIIAKITDVAGRYAQKT